MESLVFSQVEDQAEDQACLLWGPEMAANLTATSPGIPPEFLETHAEPLGTWEHYCNGPYPYPEFYSNGVGESQPQFANFSPPTAYETAEFNASDPRNRIFESEPL